MKRRLRSSPNDATISNVKDSHLDSYENEIEENLALNRIISRMKKELFNCQESIEKQNSRGVRREADDSLLMQQLNEANKEISELRMRLKTSKPAQMQNVLRSETRELMRDKPVAKEHQATRSSVMCLNRILRRLREVHQSELQDLVPEDVSTAPFELHMIFEKMVINWLESLEKCLHDGLNRPIKSLERSSSSSGFEAQRLTTALENEMAKCRRLEAELEEVQIRVEELEEAGDWTEKGSNERKLEDLCKQQNELIIKYKDAISIQKKDFEVEYGKQEEELIKQKKEIALLRLEVTLN